MTSIMKVSENGDKVWRLNGKRHREGGLPAVEWVNGSSKWVNGDKEWYVDGKRHREGGLPAVEFVNGGKAWYVNGKRYFPYGDN